LTIPCPKVSSANWFIHSCRRPALALVLRVSLKSQWVPNWPRNKDSKLKHDA
jgi:hypothetical protein